MSASTERNQHLYEDDLDQGEDWPYCECNEQPMEEEEAFNVCSSCGKPLQ